MKFSENIRDIFAYLLKIVALYVGVISLMTLLFQYINVLFPDSLNDYYLGSLSIIRTSSASIIIMWPAFIALSWFVNKEFLKHPEKKDLAVRPSLVYLTLFVAALTVLIDLITLVNSFLAGELSIRFFLKVLTILIIAGSVFAYYLWDIKRDFKQKDWQPKTFGILSSIVMLASVVIGFFIVGSPATQRDYRFDDERVSDLSSIQWEIQNYYSTNARLPENLDNLENKTSGFSVPVDPQTNEPYQYTKSSENDFSLCAEFAQESVESNRRYYYGPGSDSWKHDAGVYCFERSVGDSELKTEDAVNIRIPKPIVQ